MNFIAKPNIDITKYGFTSNGMSDTTYIWLNPRRKYRGAINLCYSKSSGRITIFSASSDAVALLCEMYKNGDIEIKAEEEFVNMELTLEEAELIKERRKNR